MLNDTEKLDLVLKNLQQVSTRLDSLDQNFSLFNEKVKLLEKKSKEQEEKITKLESLNADVGSVIADNVQLSEQVVNLKNEVGNLNQLLVKQQNEAKKASLKNELYSKRLNVIFHGIDEDPANVWETRKESEKILKSFLVNQLKIEHGNDIDFSDVHRLPQHPLYKNGNRITRPIIVKLTNMWDKKTIYRSLRALKSVNETRKLANKSVIFVSDHLPQELQDQKKKLVPYFIEAKKNNQKAIWKIEEAQYCLYVDGAKVKLSAD